MAPDLYGMSQVIYGIHLINFFVPPAVHGFVLLPVTVTLWEYGFFLIGNGNGFWLLLWLLNYYWCIYNVNLHRQAIVGGILVGGVAQLLASPADLIKVQMQMEGRRRLEGKPPR